MKITISKEGWEELNKKASYYGSEFSGNLITHKINLQATNKFKDLLNRLNANIKWETNAMIKEARIKQRNDFVMGIKSLMGWTKELSKEIDKINQLSGELTQKIQNSTR